jgi:CheY-like chemotaxis protein
VLIVDDNVDAADSLSMLLAAQGHVAEVAYRPDEALVRAAAFRPDVALLDIGLPEMDGYQLAPRLRAIPQLSGLRIFAVSGYGLPEDRQRSKAAGFDGHLVKPIDLGALQRALGASS